MNSLTADMQDLRQELAERFCLALGFSGIGLTWLLLLVNPFPTVAILAVTVTVSAFLARQVIFSRPQLGILVLITLLSIELIISMHVIDAEWLPFIGVVLAIVGSVFTIGGTVVAMSVVSAVMIYLEQAGLRSYTVVAILALYGAGMGFGWLTTHMLYTALSWAWTMERRANDLLRELQGRQAELKQTIRSLELANDLQRRTRQELVAARQRADEAQQVKERFAANISHEFRTPLNLIVGFSEMMHISPQVYGDVRWTPPLRKDVSQIYRSSRHLSELVDDVLDLSRFEIAEFALNRERVDVAALIKEAAQIAQDLFRATSTELVVNLAGELPELVIDRTRIRQVLLNLLSNAARFTEAGKVQIEAGSSDGELLISVEDSGPGIPADKLSAIFDEFYQVDYSLSRRHKGAGLGLAICKRFVEAHGGRIWVESKEGLGATFWFALPLPGGRDLVPQLVSTESRPFVDDAKARVLVLDPDPAVSVLLGRHMEDYETIPVRSEAEIESAVARYHPRAVVRNIAPGSSRLDHNVPMPVPFIECSLPSSAWPTQNLNVTACLSKPIAAARLLHEIRDAGQADDILIVDDDRGFCQLVERILASSGEGRLLRHAYDGLNGLALMETDPPDLVLLDLMMPGLDGFEILQHMAVQPELATIPVILLSAMSLAEDALANRSTAIRVYRQDQLGLDETIRCVKAMIDLLEPRYDERSPSTT